MRVGKKSPFVGVKEKAYLGCSPGNMFGKVLGRPWVESLLELINRNYSSNGDLYFSLYLTSWDELM